MNYSLGNIITLFSTMFLVGPCRQLKNITNGNRLLYSVGYIGSIIMTLYVSFDHHLKVCC